MMAGSLNYEKIEAQMIIIKNIILWTKKTEHYVLKENKSDRKSVMVSVIVINMQPLFHLFPRLAYST